jgi:hypothetical protein
MTRRTIQGVFEREDDLLRAAEAAKQAGWEIVDIYTPYPVHGAFHVLGLTRSRLPRAAFVFGLLGLGLALWFQFWVSASGLDGEPWNSLLFNRLPPASDLGPPNVGGRPWNSLPAFVPVAFEMMVLCAGLGVVLTWLLVCRLYPSKSAVLSSPKVTDDCFILEVRKPSLHADAELIRRLFRECHATYQELEDQNQDLTPGS